MWKIWMLFQGTVSALQMRTLAYWLFLFLTVSFCLNIFHKICVHQRSVYSYYRVSFAHSYPSCYTTKIYQPHLLHSVFQESIHYMALDWYYICVFGYAPVHRGVEKHSGCTKQRQDWQKEGINVFNVYRTEWWSWL